MSLIYYFIYSFIFNFFNKNSKFFFFLIKISNKILINRVDMEI